MKNFLSQDERASLKTQHKKERDKRVCDRIKAVLLFDEGWRLQQIAHVLLISDEVIRQHLQDYQSSQKLKPENGGSSGKLDNQQSKELLDHLEKHTYLYVKDIVVYVKMSFTKKYTIAGMTNWLKTHGFSYKKPAIVPGKANFDAQKQWITEYEKLKQNLPSNDAICFIDGVHPTHNTKPAYGWIKKGVRKEIPTNSGRQRLNISGAIDIDSRKVLVHEDSTLNAASTIEFLNKLKDGYPEANEVHVFCDNARYYKNKDVTRYLSTSKMTMHFLPPYSPNLNPIERLWKLMYEHVLYNRYYEKFSGFKGAVLGFFENLVDPPEDFLSILMRRITDQFRIMGSIPDPKEKHALF